MEIDKIEITFMDPSVRQIDLSRAYRLSSAQRGRYCVLSLPRPYPKTPDVPHYLQTHHQRADSQQRQANLTRIDFCQDYDQDLTDLIWSCPQNRNVYITDSNQVTGAYIRKTDMTVCIYNKQLESKLDHQRWRIEIRFNGDSFRRLFKSSLPIALITKERCLTLEQIADETVQRILNGNSPPKLPPMTRERDHEQHLITRAIKKAVLASQNAETIHALLTELRANHPFHNTLTPSQPMEA